MELAQQTDSHDSFVIHLAGGSTAVSKIFNISSQAVAQWKRNGIPTDNLLTLLAIIKQTHDIDVKRWLPEELRTNLDVIYGA